MSAPSPPENRSARDHAGKNHAAFLTREQLVSIKGTDGKIEVGLAVKLADTITKSKQAQSTQLRKLSALRSLMRAEGMSKDDIAKTLKPDLTIAVNKANLKNAETAVHVQMDAMGTGAELVKRIEDAAKTPVESILKPETIADMYLALSARAMELHPKGISLRAVKSRGVIKRVMVSGALKKREAAPSMELMSAVKTSEGYDALLKLWKAFRALTEPKQSALLSATKRWVGKKEDSNGKKLLIKDLRAIGGNMAVVANTAADANSVARFIARRKALRHAPATGVPTTVHYGG